MSEQTKGLWIIWLSIFFTGLSFFVTCSSRADCDNKDPNLKQIESTIKDIRAIYAHPSVMYVHMQKDDIKQIKEQLPSNPSLYIYLK